VSEIKEWVDNGHAWALGRQCNFYFFFHFFFVDNLSNSQMSFFWTINISFKIKFFLLCLLPSSDWNGMERKAKAHEIQGANTEM
jgi:hypothetical protein